MEVEGRTVQGICLNFWGTSRKMEANPRCVSENRVVIHIFFTPIYSLYWSYEVEPILSLPLGKIRLKIIMENDKIIQLLSGRDLKCKFT